VQIFQKFMDPRNDDKVSFAFNELPERLRQRVQPFDQVKAVQPFVQFVDRGFQPHDQPAGGGERIPAAQPSLPGLEPARQFPRIEIVGVAQGAVDVEQYCTDRIRIKGHTHSIHEPINIRRKKLLTNRKKGTIFNQSVKPNG